MKKKPTKLIINGDIYYKWEYKIVNGKRVLVTKQKSITKSDIEKKRKATIAAKKNRDNQLRDNITKKLLNTEERIAIEEINDEKKRLNFLKDNPQLEKDSWLAFNSDTFIPPHDFGKGFFDVPEDIILNPDPIYDKPKAHLIKKPKLLGDLEYLSK